MNKIQIHLPDSLYNQLRQLSVSLDYSMAELLRKGAEQIVVLYGHVPGATKEASLPPIRKLGMKVEDPTVLRRLAHSKD